ncbi:MAG: hypothetical protein D6699_00100 [Aquificota bacterium]|nr:MAG: hypothetical protein D6699_00100 [Aquificota bacterium]
MSYYRELKDFILELKGGGFFLSPRDRWFLKFLEENAYPLEVVKEGIKRFILSYPPEKRQKLPLFLSFKEIEKLRKRHTKQKGTSESWKEKFYRRLELVRPYMADLSFKEPKDVNEAEKMLMEVEKKLAKVLWDNLSQEEKRSLLKKYATFKGEEELFKLLLRRELLKRVGISSLSLFVD